VTQPTHPSGRPVYDPRGTVGAADAPLSPRLPALAGIRLGVLDNTKWNAGALLRRTVARLQEGHALAAVRTYEKASFSRPADDTLIRRIAEEVDAVVTAIGD